LSRLRSGRLTAREATRRPDRWSPDVQPQHRASRAPPSPCRP